MTNKEKAIFTAMFGLILFSFAPMDELAGKIVAIGGLAICSGIAVNLYRKSEPPAKWPGDR